MQNFSANVTVMITAARKAARGLVRDFGEVENLQVSRKGPADFVSRADRKAEEVIREELMRARPAYGWMGEESEAEKGRDGMHRWIVDPLDGTTNFLHGLPHWAVSIALERKDTLIAGVIHDPIKNETFVAEKGAGAWMNERRIRVSARREMTEAIFATGVPFAGKKTLPASLKDLTGLMPRCAGIRRFGAASLDLAYVAAGRYEGYWERELNLWDIAAGIVLVREAGGFVHDLRGGDDFAARGSIIAANADLYEPLKAQIGGTLPGA